MQLRQPYMAKQIVVDNIVSRGVFPEFYIAKVLVPSLEEQKAAVIRYKEQLLQEMGMQLNDIFDKKKADYINVIRARKHDMRPYVRELGSIERMMGQYIRNIEASPIASKMTSLLDQHKIALDKLKDLIDIFSEEQQFGKPEQFNINKYFVDLEINHDETIGYWIEYDRDDNAIAEYGIPIPVGGPYDEDQVPINPDSDLYKELIEKINNFPLVVDINHVDFERLVKNIIENAVTHGFTDSNRKDYGIGIDLTIDMDKKMFQIDFSNNGTPLPSGMNKQRYGILGEKAGISGRTGRGGYIVKSIVEHYHGDYDVFMDGQNTVVRILLPISNYDYEYE
jgi:signal transduction histidine kinase